MGNLSGRQEIKRAKAGAKIFISIQWTIWALYGTYGTYGIYQETPTTEVMNLIVVVVIVWMKST